MARIAGIDIGETFVRVAVVRPTYRRTFLEAMVEVPIGAAGTAAAIREAVGQLKPDSIAIALPGDKCYCRRVELPKAAQRELENVIVLELEASIPFEMEGAVFDRRMLPSGAADQLLVFAAVARIGDVEERIELVREALGREPDSVDTGSIVLANLVSVVPELAPIAAPGVEKPGPIAVLDLREERSELVILDGGEPSFVRTVSRGTQGLPDTAPALGRELKQSLLAWRALGGAPVAQLYMVGPGVSIHGAEPFLSAALGVPTARLPRLRLEGVPEGRDEHLALFAKAVALAMSLAGRSRSLNLRQGPLEATRSYAFLREKLPLLSGLAMVILVSFGFSLVAEHRALSAERTMLDEQLKSVTKSVFGEETLEVVRANEMLEKGPSAEDDPLPGADAYDVMLQLSKAVPQDIVHDVADFDVARGHAVIQGLLPTGTDAQKAAERIADGMKLQPCFRDVKVQKTTQAGPEKQKYVLEFDIRCEEKKDPKKKPDAKEGDG